MPALRKGYSKFIRKVEQTILAHNMFQTGDSVVIGVSGGPDSVALLYALLQVASKFSLKLGIAHLNHCLRQKDSDNDAEFVAALAEKLNLTCFIKKVEVSEYQRRHRLSPEEASRRVRYDFYNEVAERNRFNKIALGHHFDDNAELILMNLFRGSGPLGISGIPPVRNGKIVRPLIRLKKSEIIDFLSEKGIEYVSDKSNKDVKYFRNRIRQNLIPFLKEFYNPKITETLNRLAYITRCEDAWIEELINPLYEKSIIAIEGGCITLSVPELTGINIAAKKRIIRRAIARIKGNLRRITFSHIDSVVNLLEVGPVAGSLDLPDRVCIMRNNDILCILNKKTSAHDPEKRPNSSRNKTPLSSFEYNILKPESIFIKESGMRLKFSKIRIDDLSDVRCAGHQGAFFDVDSISFPLVVRNILPGDRFTPLGMTGTQKLKNYFINNKISITERLKCPVLLSKGKIIWVIGHRIDDFVKVKPSTTNVYKVELFLV